MRSLHKAFGGLKAVDGVNLTAPNGAITGLIGPNGAGKTTAFRMAYGLLRPDAGEVVIDGITVAEGVLETRRRLGVLPDVRGLYPRLTAREHIRYHGRLQGLDGPELEARISELIQRLDMTSFADRRAKGYSRGQELKVALGRALVHRPRNLILDEPSNGLDVVSSRAVRALIHEMRDAGHCILISSHIMSEVSVLCDRLVIIAEGRVIAEGTPDELREQTDSADLEEVFIRLIGQSQAGGGGS